MSRAGEALRPQSSGEQRALLAALLRDRAQAAQDTNASARPSLSHGQRTLWMLHQRAPASPAYNTAFVIRVRSPVDAAALQSSLSSLAVRHEALRTTFVSEHGRPVAQTALHPEPGFEQVHAGGWVDDALQARVAADYRRPFDLQRGPLLRATLYTRADSDHVLLLALHHIICDAWSMWVLMHELGQLYPAALAGRNPGLPPPQAQFSDFVAWQDELLSGPEGDRIWQYWRETLSGELPVLQLPTDRPRSAVQNAQGASHPFRIAGRIVEAATELGRTQGATLFVVLLAAFYVLLHRHTGQDDILVGSPVAGRNNPDMASTVGYLANPVPLRAKLSGNPTFREFVSRLRHDVLDALAHQDMPFPLLVERLQPKRQPGRWPVVEAMLVFQRPPKSQEFLELLGGATTGHVRWAGLDVEAYPLAQMEGQFDLTLEVIEARDGLSCVLKYDLALFEAATARRMAGHFTTLLEAAVADPDQPIGLLPLLPQAERAELLAFSRGPRRDYDLGRCLHHWIEDQVERSPESPAVMLADAGGAVLTYRELNAQSNRLARRLMALGAGPDSVVGVLAERSLELMVAVLGVLKAGAAYLPLDPEQPRQRLAAMIADARAPILVASHAALAGGLLGLQVIGLDEDWQAAAEAVDANPSVQVEPDHLAYLIYTSGSTGRPKGVENNHRGICNRLLWMQEAYRLDGSDRVLQKTTVGFDVSVWELFWPLMTGACLVMARPGGHRDRDYLADTIARCRITTVHFVPSMLRVFLEADAAPSCRTALRRVVCSGEALPPELETRFFDRLGSDVELYNLYGPTEAAVDVTHWRCRPGSGLRTVPIGTPIANTVTYLLDGNMQPVPVGIPSELHIGGVALARGYRGRPELTAEKFIPDPFGNVGGRLYRTGDLCRWLPSGAIEYLHRIDSQTKIRGVRVEPGEVEAVLRDHPLLRDAVVRVDRSAGDARLIAWIVPRDGTCPPAVDLRHFLADRLPEPMIPARFVPIGVLPLGASGKLDAAALPLPGQEPLEPATDAPPRTDVERRVAAVWREVLGVPQVGTRDNFFDLGGHSLLLAELQTGLANAFGSAPSIVDMFRHTTVQALAGFYSGEDPAPALGPAVPMPAASGIAVIGMAGRFPGAEDVDALWRNLCDGVESIARFDEAELKAAGVDPAVLLQPNHVPAFGALAGIEGFDAGFFGMTPREADLTDVQHRLLLECAWSALEHAGHDPAAEGGRCGVFAGVGMNRYLLNNLMPNRELMASVDAYQLMLGNDKDFAPTRISYRLGLNGPSVSVQTACSTSLVAVHLACRSLLANECDIALAGGCSVTLPQDQGYLHQEGMILSPDGHCRAFDAQAGGTVGGSGVGMVVLKRLEAALADGDTVHAVIKGTAINNDGAAKAGYTAPSVEGQAAAITAALSAAGTSADSIGLVEAHGTGTPLGDPIEVAALSQAFRASTDRTGYCAIGSVKTNLGHLDTAAGVTGLIKATLAVEHGMLPPTLHFQVPNPALDLARSPFFVPTALRPWEGGGLPRRAGVSSFGIGGTNAHAVLEQAPVPEQGGPGRPFQLFVLSAREVVAVDDASARLARHLRRHPDMDPADAAYTLARGRRAFGHRQVVVSRGTNDAAAALEGEPGGPFVLSGEARACAVALMFPGQGSQHTAMAAGLYRDEPVFREHLDRCAELLRPHLGRDIRHVLYPEETETQHRSLLQSGLAQPALFAVEYALAQLWMAWGVRPGALVGHSLGEYVAACLAGVWSLEDALAIVAWRAELMHRQGGGGMLAVALAEDEVRTLLPPGLALAAVNGPGQCVVSGPLEAVEALSRNLAARGAGCQRLQTSHAFHSPSMDEPARLLAERMRRVACRPPRIAFVSSLTGTWIEPGQACDPDYWARHMRETVRFSDALDTVLQDPARCLVEAGPGNALGTLALRHPRRSLAQTVVSSLPRPQDRTPETAHLLQAAGTLWANGVELDWAGFYAGQRRRRVPLPAYPFQRRRHWIDPPGTAAIDPAPVQRAGIEDWFYVPSWQQSLVPKGAPEPGQHWLLFMDELGVGDALAARLQERGDGVTRVFPGACFARLDTGAFVLHPGARDEYGRLAEALRRSARLPGVVVHLWNVTAPGGGVLDTAEARDRSFHSLVFLARSLAEEAAGSCHILVASTGLFDVTGDETLDPAKALLLGPVVVIPQEHAGLTCGSVDLDLAPRYREDQIQRLLAEAAVRDAASTVAYRGPHRWTQIFTPAPLPPAPPPLRPGGRYLITGGTGGIGLHMAEWLARTAPGARLALVARSAVPAGEGRAMFPGWGELVSGFAQAYARTEATWQKDGDRLPVFLQAVDKLCAAYVARFLQSNGFEAEPGRTFTYGEIRSRLGVLPKFERFLDFLLDVLLEEGVLSFRNGVLVVERPQPPSAAEQASQEFRRRFPDLAPMDDLLQHCAAQLGPALSGQTEAIGVLYPQGELNLRGAERAFSETLSRRTRYVEMLGDAIVQLARRPGSRKLRILEVGGGGGELSFALLERLRAVEVEYCVTDILRSIVLAAERRTAEYGMASVRFAVLDIGDDPVVQGFQPGAFDVVVGLDVVHATPNVRSSLANLKTLLAPGGLLCLLETVKAQRHLSMIWGFAAGWWHFEDHELRHSSPLLSLPQWTAAVRDAGFAESAAWPAAEAELEATDFGLVVAQAPDDAGPGGNVAPRAGHLLELGVELLTVQADVADREQMRRAIDRVRGCFGGIDGVIHAAGVAGGGTIAMKTREAAEQEFAAKVDGTMILASLLEDEALDFFVLCSSLTSATGGFGQVAYSAANAFEDAFAHAHAHTASGPARRFICIDWDRWHDVGMAATLEARHRDLTGEELEGGMRPTEALEAFARILAASPAPRVVVCTRDFPDLIRQSRSWQLGRIEWQLESQAAGNLARHARPAMASEFVAPDNETERRIAEIWQEELGIDQIGAHDDFFALGGDSLVAIKLMARLQRALDVPLRQHVLYGEPTVAKLAEHVAAVRWAALGDNQPVAADGFEEGLL